MASKKRKTGKSPAKKRARAATAGKPAARRGPSRRKAVSPRASATKPAASKAKKVAGKAIKKAIKEAIQKAVKAGLKKAAAPARKPAKRAAPKKAAARPRVKRREAGGHIEPTYAKDLLAKASARPAPDHAFVDEPRTEDDLAEELGEEAVETMTSGEDEGEDVANQVVPEERGGPFVVTSAGTEFADGVDESNPRGAKREPFPTT